MKYRKELLHKQYHQSDILNIKTGYYKTENIYPITPKPTESNKKIKEFIPHYKEIKPRLRLYNDLLGHFHNKTFIINDLKLPLKRQYSEIQNLRKYNKTIRDNCFDEKGNFSAKKRFKLEFFGKEKTLDKKLNKSIKEKRKMELNKNDKIELKIKRIKSCRNIHKIEKKDNNKKQNNNNILLKPKEKLDNNNKNLDRNNKRSLTNIKLNKPLIKEKSPTKNIKRISNEFKKDIKAKINKERKNSIKLELNNKKKEQEGNDYYNIEIINNIKEDKKNVIIVDKKKLNQLFLKNGLHLYDFKDEGMNIASNDNNKFEAKLRKNKKDENFEKNYNKVIRELNKINIKVNRCGMNNDNCLFNKFSKIRKGTHCKNLKKNNTNINYGIKRDKGIQPQKNPDYKNVYKLSNC